MGSIDPEIPAYGADNENCLDGVSTKFHSTRLLDNLPELYSENVTAKILRAAIELLSNNVSGKA